MSLADPIKIRATIKKTMSNLETGERQIILSVPQEDAAWVGTLSIMDNIVFDVTFTPTEAQ